MRSTRSGSSGRAGLLLGLTALATLSAGPARAANHREAPITALDRPADITDFFSFVSYDDPEKVTLILCVDPLLEPSNGPNYFPFDPEILYEIKVDNDQDAIEDVVFRFRFKTEIRAPLVFTALVGAGLGIAAPDNSPAPVPPGTPIVPPAITALDGPGSEGLNLRQTYSVSVLRPRDAARGKATVKRPFEKLLAQGLVAVPSNVGPRTMPDYESLVAQGVYVLSSGIRTFAGTVEDPFWIDLGATFDSLNFRSTGFPAPGVLTDEQEADDAQNFAADDVAGYNVNAIAIEVPISLLTVGGAAYPAGDVRATIGTWGTTSRPRVRSLSSVPGGASLRSADYVQIQRMGNPLFNELLIGTGFKDRFSQSQPRDDAQFASFATDPLLARVLNAIYGELLPVPAAPRADLLPLVRYLPPIAAAGTEPGPIADLLRLNTGVPPTPAAARRRMGLLAGDGAGFPNGRRLSDDVTDIAARVVAGVLAGAPFASFPHNRIGDGVNTNDVSYREVFPYLGPAHDGRNSRHVDPGEIGGGPID